MEEHKSHKRDARNIKKVGASRKHDKNAEECKTIKKSIKKTQKNCAEEDKNCKRDDSTRECARNVVKRDEHWEKTQNIFKRVRSSFDEMLKKNADLKQHLQVPCRTMVATTMKKICARSNGIPRDGIKSAKR